MTFCLPRTTVADTRRLLEILDLLKARRLSAKRCAALLDELDDIEWRNRTEAWTMTLQ